MSTYYILVDVDANGNWSCGKPYQDKQLAFNSNAKYPGNTVTPYAQFVAVDLPDTLSGVATAVKVTAIPVKV
jgi:hypothetical protein